jgi:hypothetical protein
VHINPLESSLLGYAGGGMGVGAPPGGFSDSNDVWIRTPGKHMGSRSESGPERQVRFALMPAKPTIHCKVV